MTKDIARKSLMNLWVRILMILVVGVYVLIPKAENIFDIITYLMIAYGAVTLLLVIYQILQPNILLSLQKEDLLINLVFNKVRLNRSEIASYVIKEQSNRGYVHNYGKIIITKRNGSKISIYNVKDINEVDKQLKTFFNEKPI